MQRIYLDHNATTPVDPAVVETVDAAQRELFGNPSSRHWFGQRARAAVEEARDKSAQLLGCSPAEIIFTSSGTESDNLALVSAARLARESRRKILVSAIEHHAVLRCARALADDGWSVELIHTGADGIVDLDDLRRRLDSRAALLALMLANNETGVIQPVAEAARMARRHGVAILCDAVQAVGKVRVQVDELGVDFLALSGHKFSGPKGVGALYVRRRTRVHPLMRGGGQEQSLRPGTENVPGIAGLGCAAALAGERLPDDGEHLRVLRDLLESRLLSIPGAARNGAEHRVPNTTSLAFERIDADRLVMSLDLRGIAVSTGAACAHGSIEPSHVLQAMGLPRSRLRSSIRFSLGRSNTAEEIERAAAIVADEVENQRKQARRRG